MINIKECVGNLRFKNEIECPDMTGIIDLLELSATSIEMLVQNRLEMEQDAQEARDVIDTLTVYNERILNSLSVVMECDDDDYDDDDCDDDYEEEDDDDCENDGYDMPDVWMNDTGYKRGNKVRFQGVAYTCIKNHSRMEESPDMDKQKRYWKLT